MNCPFCNKRIFGFTGLQEAQKFRKHLNRCRKNPDNHLSDGKQTVSLGKSYDLRDALEVRAKSGQ
jgi:hypothetical protein